MAEQTVTSAVLKAILQVDTKQWESAMRQLNTRTLANQKRVSSQLTKAQGLVGKAITAEVGPRGGVRLKEAVPGAIVLQRQLKRLSDAGVVSGRQFTGVINKLTQFQNAAYATGKSLNPLVKNVTNYTRSIGATVRGLERGQEGEAKIQQAFRKRVSALQQGVGVIKREKRAEQKLAEDVVKTEITRNLKILQNNAKLRGRRFSQNLQAQRVERKADETARKVAERGLIIDESKIRKLEDRGTKHRLRTFRAAGISQDRMRQQQEDAELAWSRTIVKQESKRADAINRAVIKQKTAEEKALQKTTAAQQKASDKQNKWYHIFRRRSDVVSSKLEYLSASGAGLLAGMSALQGNIQGLGFSLLFLHFSLIPVALAVAGLIVSLGTLAKATEISDRFKRLRLQLRGFTGDAKAAGGVFDILSTLALKYGDSVDEAVAAGMTLRQIGPLSEDVYRTAKGLALARGTDIAAASEELVGLIGQMEDIQRIRGGMEKREALLKFRRDVGRRYGLDMKQVTSIGALRGVLTQRYAPLAEEGAKLIPGATRRAVTAAERAFAPVGDPFGEMVADAMNYMADVISRGQAAQLVSWSGYGKAVRTTLQTDAYGPALKLTDKYIGNSLIPNSLERGLDHMADLATNWVGSFVGPFKQTWIRISQQFNMGYTRTNTIWQRLRGLARQPLSFITDMAYGAFQAGENAVKSAWSGLTDLAGNALSFTVGMIWPTVEWIQQQWNNLSAAVGNLVKYIWTDMIWPAVWWVQQSWSNISDAAGNLVKYILTDMIWPTWEWIQQRWADLSTAAGNLTQLILTDMIWPAVWWVQQSWTNLSDAVGNLVQWIGVNIRWPTWEDIEQAWQNLLGGRSLSPIQGQPFQQPGPGTGPAPGTNPAPMPQPGPTGPPAPTWMSFPWDSAVAFVESFSQIMGRYPNLYGTESEKYGNLLGWWNTFMSRGGGDFYAWVTDPDNVLNDLQPIGLARGGIVTRPTLGLVGEAGPEAVIPLGSGGAVGGANINININLSGAIVSNAQTVHELANLVGEEVVRELRLRKPNIVLSGF